MRHHHHQRTLQVKQHLLPLMPLSYQHTNQSQDRIQLIQRPIGFYPDIVFIYTLSAMNIRFPLISLTDLGSILECLYEVYGTDGTMLIAGNKLSDTVIYPFIRMIKKKCKAVDAEKLNLMLWKIYMVSSRKEEFVTAAKKELQPYLTKKDEKQIDTTYDTTYTIDRRH